jgi:hypothetical protein
MQTGAEVDRSEKVRTLVADESLLEGLRVCLENQNENCGRCVKCLRTMVTLRIIGKQGPFPRVMTLKEIRRLELASDHDLYFAIDNAKFAAAHGDTETLRAIQRAIRRYDRTQTLVQLDRWLLRGWLRQTRRRYKNYSNGMELFVERPDLEL